MIVLFPKGYKLLQVLVKKLDIFSACQYYTRGTKKKGDSFENMKGIHIIANDRIFAVLEDVHEGLCESYGKI